MKFKFYQLLHMKFRNLIQQADYTLILPKKDIQPLALILRKEKNIFSWFRQIEGSLINSYVKDLFVMAGRGSSYPKITEQELPDNLIGSDLVDGSGNFTTNFIAKAQFQAGISAKKSKNMLFSFKDAKELSINLIKLDEYLLSAKLNINSPTFSDAVKKDNIFVITSVLTSKELDLTNTDDFNFSGNIKADMLDEYVKASAKTSYTNNKIYSINSVGDVPLTFAVKAVRIFFAKDKFRIKPEKINVRETKNEIEYFNEKEEIILE